MTNNLEFTSMLWELQSSNRFAQATAMKAIAAYIQVANSNEFEKLLELLISTHDLEIQVKILSILAAYLMNNGKHYGVIIKDYPIYDTILNLLVRGLPLKATTALNFLVALLCYDDERQRGLATTARNMIRVSGCLNAMAEMFSNSMMYQDTWVALCQSLAEACSGSELNQSYCSHLVPLCVDRCQQGSVDVCAVLQSLLHNHDRNVKIFIESKGLAIFTRQALQYNMCMQVLSTVVERSPEAVARLRHTDVVHHLHDFLRLYGPHSQMGQWSTIILFHFDSFNRGEEASTANVRTTSMREPELLSTNGNKTNMPMKVRTTTMRESDPLSRNVNKTNTHMEVRKTTMRETGPLSRNVNKTNTHMEMRTNTMRESEPLSRNINETNMSMEVRTTTMREPEPLSRNGNETNTHMEVRTSTMREPGPMSRNGNETNTHMEVRTTTMREPGPMSRNGNETNTYMEVRTTTMRELEPLSRNRNKTNTPMEVDHTISGSRTKDFTASKHIKNNTATKNDLLPNLRQRSGYVSERDNDFRYDAIESPELNLEDTANLFQNVIKEVIYWKSRNQMNAKKPATRPPTPLVRPKPTQNFPNVINFKQDSKIQNKQHRKTLDEELSFSAIQEHNIPERKPSDFYRNDKIIDSLLADTDIISSNFENRHFEDEIQEQSNQNEFRNTINNDQTVVTLRNFNPPFQSTPKRNNKPNHPRKFRRSRNFRKNSRNYTKVSKVSQPENASMTKQNSTLNPTRDIKQTSMSSRIFNVINESCTSFVKSMKNIFRSKQQNTNNDKPKAHKDTKDECSYSFTNYMRKRDALLERELSDEDLLEREFDEESYSSLYKVDSCKTCKDTIILQQKMVQDNNLKHTVQKLKTGINLYGCDFKKISRAFWPRDKYMTPEMLYNLYRKLIVKGGHGNHEFRQKAYNIVRKK